MPDQPTTALWNASRSQSWANVLSPGIVGLFIQGIETGMIFSQLATWLSLPRPTEHCFVTTLTVFITTIGLIQTAVYFFSTWRIYVEHYGEPTVLISTPVQSLLLWRCYHILKRSKYFIIPLVLLLLGTVALGIFDTIWLLGRTYGWGRSSHLHPFWTLLPLQSWILFLVASSRKRVYADQAVQGQRQMWYPTLHAVIGKLYVLSHFYNINSLTFFVGEQEQPSTHLSALTVPALHGTSTARNTPEEHRIELYSNSIDGTDGSNLELLQYWVILEKLTHSVAMMKQAEPSSSGPITSITAAIAALGRARREGGRDHGHNITTPPLSGGKTTLSTTALGSQDDDN
ncbi:hypothetical protein EDB89DRAFT_1903370 [Lactarius sanguifluus]|nr:hypothetical protein EDB89DRAFT_1903370 [Lactarius sanguifluus]